MSSYQSAIKASEGNFTISIFSIRVHNESSYDIRPLDRKETTIYRTRNQLPRRRTLLPILEYQTRPPSCQSSPVIQRSGLYPPVHDKHPAAPSHRPQAATSGEPLITGPCIPPKDFSKNQFFSPFWQTPENTHLPHRLMQVPEKNGRFPVFSEICEYAIQSLVTTVCPERGPRKLGREGGLEEAVVEDFLGILCTVRGGRASEDLR